MHTVELLCGKRKWSVPTSPPDQLFSEGGTVLPGRDHKDVLHVVSIQKPTCSS